ncbi:MAG: 50S ribosomal protein L2 [Candidatus Diapherotrites archaeon]|nr:50S ribosomal protein L2 [Candidatus Diapherotrites archaeon]MDZ4256633.1 50S ribosomal protein L2 [archaeon]
MGKRLIHQRRGKGGTTFRASFHGVAGVRYVPYTDDQRTGKVVGQVMDLVDDPTKTAVLGEILLPGRIQTYIIAPEGLMQGQRIEYGKDAGVEIGNILPLRFVPEGAPICNVEIRPGDGGKLVRGSGGYAVVVTKEAKHVLVKLPSGKTIHVHPDARATIGMVSCATRTEKPFMKAGKKHHERKAKRKRHAIVRGVAMNPNAHPFGGSQHHPGKSKSTARGAPAGRKVGAIASRRTGRRKKN